MADSQGKDMLDSLLVRLEVLELELRTEIDSLKEHAKTVALEPQAVGRAARDGASQQQSTAQVSLARCEQRLEQVYHAMRHLESDSYGYCEICDDPISRARL
ncbi:hypothetical protein QKW35_13180 [Pontibacterium granulatum]|uniref:hypothetical protein n=1 Tax=Pontibacterium granulatum TaxID=2036029 RepID=UPI002499BAA7|nr:hypothetical protein [Pontibacterium granulatum]MDI3325334.1 hypothetical protein [Pontibacterium granulatum]